MKKILSILAAALTLVGCAHFDDPKTENYGKGPAVEVTVTNTTDNAFTVSIVPAEGTTYYAYLIDESAEVEELDSYTLLQKKYGGTTLLNTKDNETYTFTASADPNTDYVVYAVASNDKGITGEVVAVQVKTSDGEVPSFRESRSNSDGSVDVAFSEAVLRGDGEVSAFYFAEWSGEEFEVPAEDITVTINGNVVSFSVANVPAGAYLFFSWADGAFKDAVGNPCAKYESGINWNTGELVGLYDHVATVPFEISDDYVYPASDRIKNWEEEQIELVFPFGIYRNDEELNDDDVQILYVSEGKQTLYDIATDAWSVEDSVLSITLPAEPALGDVIKLYIGEGVIYDDFGNPNAEYSFDGGWEYDNSAWAPQFIGTFRYTTFFGEPDDPADDEGLVLYQSLDDTQVYKIEGVFYGVDFVFTLDSDGMITWEPQFSGYHMSSYDADVYVLDAWSASGGKYDQGYYEAGVFYFPTYYYMYGLGGWYDGYETFTLTGRAGAKARSAAAKKTMKANNTIQFTKNSLVESLRK